MSEISRIPYLTEARCVACDASHPLDGTLYTCTSCGGTLDLIYDYDAMERRLDEFGREGLNPTVLLSPVRIDKNDKLYFDIQTRKRTRPAARLSAGLGMLSLTVLDDTTLPSASFKDRASLAVLMRARELGLDTVAAASTGNAGASLACLSARMGLKAVVFAPRNAPAAKLRQIQAYGARLVLVDGNYDLAYELCLEAVRERGWYSRNTAHNPWCAEGKKSAVLNLATSASELDYDVIFVPAGDGCILAGIHKGLVDLQRIGWIERLPRLVAVQAEGSAAIANAWFNGAGIEKVSAQSVADSIVVDYPRDGLKALRAIRETGGFALTLRDAEILQAVSDLARLEGIFAEPAGAASLAGVAKALRMGLIEPETRVLALVTGHGLKDRDALAPLLNEPEVIASLKELT